MSAIRDAIRNVIGADMYRPDSLPIYRGGGGGGIVYDYATWNPDDKALNFTLSNGNLTATETGTGFDSLRATFGKASGTGCFEITFNDFPGGGELFVGVGTASATLAGYFVGLDAFGWGYYSGGGKFRNGAQTAYGSGWNSGDVMMVEVNIDTAIMEIFKNTVSQGTIDISALSGAIFPMASCLLTTSAITINCGQEPFSRTPSPGIFAGWIADEEP